MRNTSTSKGYLDESDFPNVWLGVSVENQKAADERIPLLLQTPAAVRFLSCEPLLGEIRLDKFCGQIHWVICGGESGPITRRIRFVRAIHAQANLASGAPMLRRAVFIVTAKR